MPDVTITATNPRAGNAAASGEYYNISSTDSMNGVASPKASNITWTFALPTGIPWGACKIISADVDNVRVYNSASSKKNASWVFRTAYQSSTWNGSLAKLGTTVVWRNHGLNNGNWIEANTNGVTYNNVQMNANALTWILQEFRGGRNVYFSYIETRSAGGSITNPNYSGTTYSTRMYVKNYYPKLTINYEIVSSTRYWDGSAWKLVIPKYWDGSAWKQCIGKYWDGSAWKQI
jgi:hypothetical protein